MTEGLFTTDGEPALRLRVKGLHQARVVEAVIDTGFTGELTLPPALIASLGLPKRTQEEVMLGDGTVRTVQMYAASVIFAEQEHRVLVGAASTTPLVGTDLLRGFSLRIDFREGGRVEVRKRSEADRR